jgi:ribonuclease Z
MDLQDHQQSSICFLINQGWISSPFSQYQFSNLFHHFRYLINCGEGSQRLAQEHKLKLARLEHIFLTRTTWDKVGGLPGLCLTVQEAGVPNLQLYGPRGIEEIFEATKKFCVLRELKVTVPECKNDECFDDNVMTMHFVHLHRDKKVPSSENLSVADPAEKDPPNHIEKDAGSTSESSSSEDDDDEMRREEKYVVSYICKLKPRPGQLDLSKCVEKGVKPGPLLGKLKNGVDVLLEDGTLVLAQDVCGATDPGSVCICEYFLKFRGNP